MLNISYPWAGKHAKTQLVFQEINLYRLKDKCSYLSIEIENKLVQNYCCDHLTPSSPALFIEWNGKYMEVALAIGAMPIVLKFLEKLLDLETKTMCVLAYSHWFAHVRPLSPY